MKKILTALSLFCTILVSNVLAFMPRQRLVPVARMIDFKPIILIVMIIFSVVLFAMIKFTKNKSAKVYKVLIGCIILAIVILLALLIVGKTTIIGKTEYRYMSY